MRGRGELTVEEQARLDALSPAMRALARTDPIVKHHLARFIRGEIDGAAAVHAAHLALSQWLFAQGCRDHSDWPPDEHGVRGLAALAAEYRK